MNTFFKVQKNNNLRAFFGRARKHLILLLIFGLLSEFCIVEIYAKENQKQNQKTPEKINILTWEGYITKADILKINDLLNKSGYNYQAQVITPYAEDAEQMFDLVRNKKADILFLTLFFIKLQNEKIAKLIQPINTSSPRLSNYKYLLPSITNIEMGMAGKKPLYIPFAGGCYGFYANRKKVEAKYLPKSWADLLDPRWKGKYSLNRSQVWYNIAIASMILGKPPYYLNKLAEEGKRDLIKYETKAEGQLMEKLILLYSNAGNFWDAKPSFPDYLQIVSSWGIEVEEANKKGGDWQLINFKEGNLVWMDTMNFAKELEGKKLEAAEIVANYFIGKEVQSRVAGKLSLVAVSSLAKTNPILKNNPKFFVDGTFVPPYHVIADNVMNQLSKDAFNKIETKKK